MAKKVFLEKNGIVKQGFVGFSWTTLFFNFFVPLFRADFKYFFIMLASFIGLALLSAIPYSHGLAGSFIFIFPFKYNRWYTTKLLEDGFEPSPDDRITKNLLVEYGFTYEV